MNWGFFAGLDDTSPPANNVKLSTLDKALIVSALNFLQDRNSWENVTDAEWDTIEAQIGSLSDDI